MLAGFVLQLDEVLESPEFVSLSFRFNFVSFSLSFVKFR